MRIRMLETRRGTEDGYTVRQYVRDEIYEMGDSLARSFLAAGFAVKTPKEELSFTADPTIKKPRRRAATCAPEKVVRKSRKKQVSVPF